MSIRPTHRVAIIGGGPAGLIAAETLAEKGVRVTVYERMPTPGRKFLMAGRGGLNLTHSEPLEAFLDRYAAGKDALAPVIANFTPADLRRWADGLEAETFVGSSGRVFPRAMKASPLMRAWRARLEALGVAIQTRHELVGWDGDQRPLIRADGETRPVEASAVLLALGGASWPRLGSDGSWAEALAARGVAMTPFAPSNSGFAVAWSDHFKTRFAGAPIKAAAFSHDGRRVRGEAMISAYGIEGGAVYALSASLRFSLAREGRAWLEIDLKPDVSEADLAARLKGGKTGDSVANLLRKTARLTPVQAGLLRESVVFSRGDHALPREPEALAAAIKGAAIPLGIQQGLERAISSAGGIALDGVDAHFMLKSMPGVFAAGEMLDWDAPTGGYLLQASFATGRAAALGVIDWLKETG